MVIWRLSLRHDHYFCTTLVARTSSPSIWLAQMSRTRGVRMSTELCVCPMETSRRWWFLNTTRTTCFKTWIVLIQQHTFRHSHSRSTKLGIQCGNRTSVSQTSLTAIVNETSCGVRGHDCQYLAIQDIHHAICNCFRIVDAFSLCQFWYLTRRDAYKQ